MHSAFFHVQYTHHHFPVLFQDFDDWDDVGLNTPKPPDLLHLYRDYGHHTVPEIILVLKAVREEKTKLEEELAKLQAEYKQLLEEAGELRFENLTLNDSVQHLERYAKILLPNISHMSNTPGNCEQAAPQAAQSQYLCISYREMYGDFTRSQNKDFYE